MSVEAFLFRGYTGSQFIYGETILFREVDNQWTMLVENELGEEWVCIDKPYRPSGISDFDGKAIYEGDIVVFESFGPGDTRDGFKGVVVFEDCKFWCENKEKQMAYPLFTECQEWRILGNIVENAELIK